MRAYLVFTHSGPILVMTTCSCVTEQALLETFHRRGIEKFIAYEVPMSSLQRLYGVPFEVVLSDLERGQAMRVLDFNGPHILDSFSLSDLGEPIPYEH